MNNDGKQYQAYGGARRVTIIAVTIILIAVVAVSLMLSGVLDYQSDPSVLASTCTLTCDTGAVEIREAGSDDWDDVEDGAVLQAGTRIRTTAISEALLTFFNGSTFKLEPNTDILIEQLECDENRHTVIVIRQWIGTTWSRVVEMVDPGSRYEIRTPSAAALVRGTYFMVKVDETGSTTVKVIEGEVIVTGLVEDTKESEDEAYDEEHEILVPAGYRVIITRGSPLPPSEKIPVDSSHSDIQPEESAFDPSTPTPAPSPTIPYLDKPAVITAPTPVYTCSAYITFSEHLSTCSTYTTFSEHPGEFALVEVHRNIGEETVQHGETLNINYQLQYMGPIGPILARPIVFIADSDSQLIRTWSMTKEGVMKPNRESTEPYPIGKGSTFSLNIFWDLTDSSGQYLPADEYVIQATIETPYADESNRFHLLDCTTPNYINVIIQE